MQNTIVIISYTTAGAQLQERIAAVVKEISPECETVSFAYKDPERAFVKTEEILDRYFDTVQLIVFISATGIAVRKIAPYLKSKTTDPAVLCMDEAGRFVIPLVSGHLGGANDWAKKIAEQIGAVAVITTATDVEKVFAVDLFAKKNGLRIADSNMIKEVSARLLAGETVGICSAYEIGGKVPEGLVYYKIKDSEDRPECGVTITENANLPKQFEIECRLFPKNLVLGIGCRKGISAEKLECFVKETMAQNGLDLRNVHALASIDLKKEEAGIRALAEKLDVPFLVFRAEELQACGGDFSASAFVAEQVGVDNVCERSAVCAAGAGAKLLFKKTASEGMTLAAASLMLRIDYNIG